MKPLPIIALILALAACSSRKDPVESAQKANEAHNEVKADQTASPAQSERKLDYDTEFMTKAASGGMLEVSLGKLITAQAVTPQAKEFAQHMITDHTQANKELQALAARKGVSLPTGLSDAHKSVYDKVANQKGIDIDKTYLQEMEDDHEEDVKEYTEASQRASDPDLKAFAAKTVPLLKQHLTMVQQMRSAVDARK